jgi:hypothetical protein
MLLFCGEVNVETSVFSHAPECDGHPKENLPERIKFGPLILSEGTDTYALE